VGGAITINGTRDDEVYYAVSTCHQTRINASIQDTAAVPIISEIKGKVVDEKGEGMIQATVVLLNSQGQSTGKGTVTDYDGNFELRLAPGSYDIRISYAGYSSQIIKDIKVVKDKCIYLNSKMEVQPPVDCGIVYCCCCRHSLRDEEKPKSEEAEVLPTILRAYPVPLASNTALEYTLKNAEELSISLLDIDGREVSIIKEQQVLEQGAHKEVFSLPDTLPSGIYFITIRKASGDQTLKVLK
jgi:hypothetical protein